MGLLSLLIVSNLVVAQNSGDIKLTNSQINECKSSAVARNPDVSQDLKNAMINQCLELKKSEMRIQQQQKNQDRLKKETARCIKERTNVPNKWFFFFDGSRDATAEDLRICANQAAVAEASASELQKDIEQQQAVLQSTETSFSHSVLAAEADAAKKERIQDIVDDEFKSMQISILKLLRQADKGVLQMNKLSAAIDNSAMGLYLRDRLASTMNSPAMCSAVKDCSAGKTPGTKAKDLDSVFNGKSNTQAGDVQLSDPAAPASKGTTK